MVAIPHAIPDLDRKGLRQFGLTTGAIVAGLFGVVFPLILGRDVPWWPWILAGLLATGAWLAPMHLKPLYRGWMRFGLIMGRITTPIVLGVMFFFVVTPIALIRHALGKDALKRGFDGSESSYRVQSEKRAAASMERPY